MPVIEFSEKSKEEDWSNGISVEPPTKKARPLYREFEKTRVWRIAHKFKFNPEKKERKPWGSVVVAQIWKDKPYKISFTTLGYFTRKGEKPAPDNIHRKRWTLSLKHGRLNLYEITKQVGVTQVRNKSNNCDLTGNLNLNKTAEFKRLARVINIFLKENSFKERMILKKIDDHHSFRVQFFKLFYPALKNIDAEIDSLGGCISHVFREPIGLKKILKSCVGASGKKITNLALSMIAKEKGLTFLEPCARWKGLIPLDHISKLLQDDMYLFFWRSVRIQADVFRRFLRQFSPERRTSLFLNYKNEHVVKDTVAMWNVYKDVIPLPPDVIREGWEKMHNYLFLESFKIKDKPRVIEYTKKEKWFNLQGEKLDEEYTIVLPLSTIELVEWGRELNMCIGGIHYQDDAVANRCLLGALYNKEGKLCYCFQVMNNALNQFYGYNNRINPSKELYKKFSDFLLKRDILKKEPSNFSEPLRVGNFDGDIPF